LGDQKLKSALITGVSGQGGAYLAQHLCEKGYRVSGTTRDIHQLNDRNLAYLGLADRVSVRGLDLCDRQSVLDLIDQTCPDEIYHLAATSSVARSFKEPARTIQSITQTTVNLLDAIRKTDKSIPCFIATSTEIFGNCDSPATVNTAHNPMSPYGVGKSCAHFQARNYREAYGLYVCSGILSNFESPLRPRNYVTSKIVNTACQIALGETNTIELGNLSVRRDWGSARDFMQAAHLSLQQDEPKDYLIATGKTYSLKEFLHLVFSCLGMDYRDHLLVKESLLRPLDIRQTLCNPEATEQALDWKASTSLQRLVTNMLSAELTQQIGAKEADSMLNKHNSNVVALGR
jgi:GDPmannose 4,6-dehydratase